MAVGVYSINTYVVHIQFSGLLMKSLGHLNLFRNRFVSTQNVLFFIMNFTLEFINTLYLFM